MRCLVTGGEGFIGSHVVDRLVQQGHEVRVFSRSRGRFRGPLENVEYIWADINNTTALASALQGVEVVLHLAWSTLPKTSNEDPALDVTHNVVGSIRLLKGCAIAGVGRIVFASSGGTVYGMPRALTIREEHPTDPICSYGISKLAVEKYLSLFHRMSGLEWITLRCSNPYGERQNPAKQQGVIAAFLAKAARGEGIEIWGDGSIVRDYVYVGDVADAFTRAIASAQQARVLNVGSGKGLTLNEIAEMVIRITGRNPEVQRTEARNVDVPANVLDIGEAKRVLDWLPTINLVDGMERTWSWILGTSVNNSKTGVNSSKASVNRKGTGGPSVEEDASPLPITVR